MDNIKVGLIGSGFIAEPHLYSLNLLPNVDIAGICSRNEITAKSLIKKYNLDKNIFMSYEELLKLDIDAVSVCLPNYLHKDVTVDLLGSGKHVLIEKPMTSTSAQAEELLNIAEKKGLKIFVDHTFVYTGAVRKIKDVIKVIKEMGHQCSRTHFDFLSIKTDLDLQTIRKILLKMEK